MTKKTTTLSLIMLIYCFFLYSIIGEVHIVFLIVSSSSAISVILTYIIMKIIKIKGHDNEK